MLNVTAANATTRCGDFDACQPDPKNAQSFDSIIGIFAGMLMPTHSCASTLRIRNSSSPICCTTLTSRSTVQCTSRSLVSSFQREHPTHGRSDSLNRRRLPMSPKLNGALVNAILNWVFDSTSEFEYHPLSQQFTSTALRLANNITHQSTVGRIFRWTVAGQGSVIVNVRPLWNTYLDR